MTTNKPVLQYFDQLYEESAAKHKTLYRFDTKLEAQRFMNEYGGTLYIEDCANYYVTVESA